MNENILIVDDEKDIRESLSAVLQSEGYICTEAENGETALEKVEASNFDIIISDIVMPRVDGMKLLEKSLQISPSTLIVLMTAYASIETAISALRIGAADYLLKPIEFDEVIMRVKQLLKQKQLILENKLLRQQIDKRFNFNNIIGQSKSMQEIYGMIKQISTAPTNVLITGASGTGKELVARAIHNNSNRSGQPFIPVNCGAIATNLYESELFGYKKGSFTGAASDRDGLFKAANTGTIFLDEIGELPESVQVKLLRVLQEKEIRPVGSNSVIKIDVRILAATNKDLYKEVQEKRFREDLYYRLNVVEIKLPALSERKDDIPILVNHFISRFNEELNKSIKGVDNEVMKTFLQYEWRGNLRELENMIERAVLLCETDYITLKSLPPHMQQNNQKRENYDSLPDNLSLALEEVEKQHITRILKELNWNRYDAAQRLGVDTSTLYRKMVKLSIKPED